MRERTLILLCLGLLVASIQPAGAQDRKDPMAAGLLGATIGLGTPYLYTEQFQRAMIFTGVDSALIVGMALADDASAKFLVGMGLAASHVWQAIDGALVAKSINRGNPPTGRPVNVNEKVALLPFDVQFRPSALQDPFSGASIESLWAEGGASRDIATAMSNQRRLAPPLSLNIGLEDGGVGMQYYVSF